MPSESRIFCLFATEMTPTATVCTIEQLSFGGSSMLFRTTVESNGAQTSVKQYVLGDARLLLVEPDDAARRTLETAASRLVEVECHRAFETARASLRNTPFAFVVTNLRLDAFNGLNLVYLSSSGPQTPRAIVYSKERDPWAAQESHRAGAFYEIAACLPVTISAFLTATLPPHDRRNPIHADRRQQFRSGRRCWDKHLGHKGEQRTPPPSIAF